MMNIKLMNYVMMFSKRERERKKLDRFFFQQQKSGKIRAADNKKEILMH